MSWRLVYAKHALKDAKKLGSAGLRSKTEGLLEILKSDPFQNPPSYEKLVGDFGRDLTSVFQAVLPLSTSVRLNQASWRP